MITIDLVGGGRVRSQGMDADDLLASGIEAFHVTGRPPLRFLSMHRISKKLGEGEIRLTLGGEPHVGHDAVDGGPGVLIYNPAVSHANCAPPAVISREWRGSDDVPDFGRAAMHEFRAELDRKWRERIVNGEDTAADALARLET